MQEWISVVMPLLEIH